MKIRTKIIKRIIFKFTGKKLRIAIVNASKNFIVLMIIYGIVHYIMNFFNKYGFYYIPQDIENIHVLQILNIYKVFVFFEIIQIPFEDRRESRSLGTYLLSLIEGRNKIKVVTLDICPSGIGVFSQIPLEVGKIVKLSRHSLPYNYRDAVVQWYDKRRHKGGLMFIKNK